MSGYDDFLQTLRRFRSLSVLTVSGGAVVPFFAYLAKISPPWPPGIMILTAIVELLGLIISFQFYKQKSRRIVEKSMIFVVLSLAFTSVVYLSTFSQFTYQAPNASTRSIKGFVCRPEVKLAFSQECPDLTPERLADAQYRAELLWTEWSITIVRMILTLSWLLCCVLLTIFIGIFIVFQGRRR
ncbi:xanthosine utilization system XapX-like protein [Bosea sp. BE125]|uniref:hypothetical protein n=1 Tax=Bosea sp. BE125 TaxID=2817909 RepID=UPI002859C9EE|nr:hypothetical protein [Bosea sp. BE125]MDR6871114.1 xanthosine utilization system XapX-like protein [Bosea sp. BE125]